MLRNLSDAGDGQVPLVKAFNVNKRGSIYGESTFNITGVSWNDLQFCYIYAESGYI